MFLLTREVRLQVLRNAPPPGQPGHNGHAGTPPADGPYFAIAVRVTLAGEPDADSSYVRNIKDVDAAVQSIGLPLLRRHLFAADMPGFPAVTAALYIALAGAWPGCRLHCLAIISSAGTEYSISAHEPTMMRLSQRFEFSAAHRLHNPALSIAENRRLFGKCNNPLGHGHNYEVQVTLRSSSTFPPMSEIERLVDHYAISRLDHKNLNQEVEAFDKVNPSVEQIAKVIFDWLKPPLTIGPTSLASVTVWETPRTWCEYSDA